MAETPATIGESQPVANADIPRVIRLPGARTAAEPVAIRQSSYSTFVPSSSVPTLAFTSRAVTRRPRWAFTFHCASSAAVAVKTWLSAMERSR